MKFLIQRLYLILREIASGAAISIVVLLAAACSTLAVAVFNIAGDGVNRYISERFTGSIPPNTIKVAPAEPKGMQLFQTVAERPGITGAAAGRILRMKGVVSVEPVLPLDVPAQAGISFFGFGYRIDMPVLGVPYALVKKGIAGRTYVNLWKKPVPGGLIPVILPKAALQAYNDSIAGPNGLPRITERFAPGIKFSLLVGKSSLKTLDGYADETAVVAGVTDQPKLMALLIPIALAKEYNIRFNEEYRTKYLYLYVKVKDHASLAPVRDGIRGMKLSADSGADISASILRLQSTVSMALGLMKYIIMFLSAVAVAFSTVIAAMNRIDYYRILRIVGCSKIFISASIMIKYALIGFAGSLLAMALLERAADLIASYVSIPGFISALTITMERRLSVAAYGIILPLICTVPALVKLGTASLSSD